MEMLEQQVGSLIGMLLGLAPGIGWHLWHAHIRGSQALWLWGGDGAGRVLLDAGEGSDLGWRVPVIEVLEGLALAAAAAPRPDLGLALPSEPLGPLVAGLPAHLAGAILPLRTQLPWYSHLSGCPSLSCAPLLVWLVERPFCSKSAPESPIPPSGGCWCGVHWSGAGSGWCSCCFG